MSVSIQESFQKYLSWLDPMRDLKLELEEVILGACMIENKFNDVKDILGPKSFNKYNSAVWQAMISLSHKKDVIDIKTVTYEILNDPALFTVCSSLPYTTAYYVTNLTSKVNSAANTKSHAIKLVEINIIQLFSSLMLPAYQKTKNERLKLDLIEVVEVLLISDNKFNTVNEAIYYLPSEYQEVEVKPFTDLQKMVQQKTNDLRVRV